MLNIYADGVSNIALINGVVRLDLIAMSQPDNQSPQTHSVGTLAVSLPAMLRIYEQLGKVVDEMTRQGLLTKREDPPIST